MSQANPGSTIERTKAERAIFMTLMAAVAQLQKIMHQFEPKKVVMTDHKGSMFQLYYFDEDDFHYIQIAGYVEQQKVQMNTTWPDHFPFIKWEPIKALLPKTIYIAQAEQLFEGGNSEIK